MTLRPITAPSAGSAPVHAQAAERQITTAPLSHEASTDAVHHETTQPAGGKELSLKEKQKVLKESTEKFNEMSDKLNLDIKFAYNDKIDQVYLNVIDKNTGQIIRKLPSEEAMKISESMKDLIGTLFDKKG